MKRLFPIFLAILSSVIACSLICLTLYKHYEKTIVDSKSKNDTLSKSLSEKAGEILVLTDQVKKDQEIIFSLNEIISGNSSPMSNQRNIIRLKDETIKNIYNTDEVTQRIISDLQSSTFMTSNYNELNFRTNQNDLFLLYRLYLSSKYSPIPYDKYFYAFYSLGVNREILRSFYQSFYHLDDLTLHTSLLVFNRIELNNASRISNIDLFLSIDPSLANNYSLFFFREGLRNNCDLYNYMSYELKKRIELQRDMNRETLNQVFYYF
jgi:hypothetical protein